MGLVLCGSLEEYKAEVKKCVEKRLGSSIEKNVYIYGYGKMGKFVYQQLKSRMVLAGFIDGDRNKQHQIVEDNMKIYSLDEIDPKSCIIIATLFGWSDIYNKCQRLGFSHCCHYEELAFFDHTLPHWNQSFAGIAESILKNQQEYVQVYNMLSDVKSKEIFENIINFRLTMDIMHMQKAYEISVMNGEKQYFASDIISVNKEEVFIDCGGFCGETTEEFIQYVAGKYKKIYLFEPDVRLSNVAKCKWGGMLDKVEILPYGVGKEENMLSFQAVGDGSGNFSEDGTEYVKVVKIDDVIKEKITFIKMDIEGMEVEALTGAQETIKKDKPKLAISVYHKCDDIFAITKQILLYRNDYRIYMRHYTTNFDDTVMYFV